MMINKLKQIPKIIDLVLIRLGQFLLDIFGKISSFIGIKKFSTFKYGQSSNQRPRIVAVLAVFLVSLLIGNFNFNSAKAVGITQVQLKTAGNTASTTVSLTLDSTPIEDNLLIATVFTRCTSITTPSGWNVAVKATNTPNTDEGGIYYKVAGASESTSVSFTVSCSDQDNSLAVFEYSGLSTSSPLDQTATNGPTASQTSFSSGTTGTTSQDEELAIGAWFIRNAVTSPSYNNSFTGQAHITTPGSFQAQTLVATRELTATGTYSSTASWTTAQEVMAAIATFKAPTGPPQSLLTQEGYIFENDDSQSTSVGQSDWYNSSWTYRKKITVLSSKVDATLTNFPVYVDLNNLGTDFHDNVRSDGGDIRITKADGLTELPREVVAIDTGTANSGELHFKADSISSTLDTDFYIYFGNASATEPAVTATYGRNNVWTNGYEAVFHLDESGNGTSGEFINSTGNTSGQGGGGTPSYTPTVNTTSGAIGNSQNFDGTDDYITVPYDSAHNLAGTSFTISAWIYAATGTSDVIVAKPYTTSHSTPFFDWALLKYDSTPRLATWINDGTAKYSDASTITESAWNNVSAVYNGTTIQYYVDGSTAGAPSEADSVPNSSSQPMLIGTNADLTSTGENWPGEIDELRISSSTRTSTWVSTENNNQSSPSTFYSVGGGSIGGFPQVRATTYSEETTAPTAQDVDMTGVQTGDRALLVVAINDKGTTLSSFPSGWTQIAHVETGGTAGDNATELLEIWEKKSCTGAESSFQYTSSPAGNSKNRLFFITGSDSTQDAETSTGTSGTANPNADSLTPSWGAEDTLWLTAYAAANQRDAVNTYPSNYIDNQYTNTTTTSSPTLPSYGVATRELNAASEDPGNFVRYFTDRWAAVTVAVRTAGAEAGAAEQETFTPVVGESSQQAGSKFTTGKTMADVKAGERIDIRMHLTNTGAAIGTTDELALFYDKNDGIWTKVQSQKVPNLGSGDCDTDTNFDCLAVDVTDDVGSYSSMAISPDGSPSVAYYDTTNTAVMFAQFVGSGGTGCNGGSTNWSCEIVDNTGTAKGQYTSLAYDLAGNPWISYYDATGSQLVVAQYVGAGGSGCTSSAWTCENVDNTGTNTGSYTSIGFSAGGVPWVAYYDTTNGSLRVAHREGSGFGSACTDADWRCGDVDADGDDIGKYTSIAFDADDDAWISYYDDTADALLVAEYVGTGGSGCGGASAFWTCETVDNTGTITGQYSSIAISPSGIPWVSFYDTTNANLRVAHREGSGFGSACTDTDWRCAPVDSTGTVGLHSSIAFAPDGNPWISYYDDDSTATNKALKYARFVGSSGTGCADTAWDGCGKIDSAGSDAIGEYSSLAFAQNGNAWISYYDGGTEGNLRVANVYRSGEIVLSPSVVNSNGTTINEDHADMTSATDTTNRDDTGANRCIASSTTWNDGIYSEAENLTGLTLAAGDTTSQCTEISWTIDTSQASAGEAYRFVVASKDALRPDKGLWRGPIAVATDAYPTLTIAGSAKDEYRYSKDTQPIFTNCSDSSWGCMAVDVTGSVGWDSNIAFDQSGSPWVAYVDAANADILVAKFVGSGGSGCDGGSSAWDCTIVDATGSLGEWISFAIDPKGHPWISYSNGSDTSLKVANYVGSGGNCDATGGSNLWQCTTVDATDQVGPSSSIAFDQNGNAWITYKDITNDNLEVAKYVGSGGNCDSVGAGSDAWQCTTVDVTDNVGTSPSIAFDTSGSAWIAYQDTTNLNLEIAKYVGSGGNCDSVGAGSDAWQCTTVDVTDDVGSRPSIAFDSSGDASVSYFDTTNSTLEMAKYVGSGGNCDSVGAGSDGWYCEIVDDPTNGLDNSVSIAFDASGKAWMAYQDYTDDTVKVAREVGSGGSGCTGSTNSGKWTCSTIDSTMTPTAAVNLYIDLAFDMSGRAFVSYYDITNENLKIAAPHLPLNPLSSDTSVSYNGRNAGSGDFRYRLDAGLAPRTDAMGTCQANENNLGYCGLYHPDGALDSITTGLNERPIYGFATKFTSNSELPHARAHFQTDVSPSTKNLKLQVYRYGTTNAWEDIATYSSAGCSSDNCVIEGGPTGTASEYFRTSGSGYEVNFRLYQIESSTVSITLMLDGFRASQVESFMRHGAIFRENLSDPFTW